MIEFPEFCNMMAVKMNEDSSDEDLVRIAFRVLDRNGSGTIKYKEFKILMMNIGDKLSEQEVKRKIIHFVHFLFSQVVNHRETC